MMLKIIDVFPNWLTDGIVFKKLQELNKTLPWGNDLDNLLIDYDYVAHSGDKIISPIIDKLLDDDVLTPENQIKLFNMIYQKYNTNWTKLYETMIVEYNPIENYSMIEREESSNKQTNNLTDTANQTLNSTDTTNTTNTENATDTTSTTNTENSTDTTNTTNTENNTDNSTATEQTQAFNSTDWNNARKTTTDSTNNKNNTIESTNTNEKTNTVASTNTNETTNTNKTTNTNETTDQTTQAHTGTIDNDANRTLTRSGNIGVTTTQQMLESERALRQYDYFENIFNDIDKILTLAIY